MQTLFHPKNHIYVLFLHFSFNVWPNGIGLGLGSVFLLRFQVRFSLVITTFRLILLFSFNT